MPWIRARQKATLCALVAAGTAGCRDCGPERRPEQASRPAAACPVPDEQVGTVTLVSRPAADGGGTLAELESTGCAACSGPKPGAPRGSVCQAASVCAQICCACPDGRATFLARACLDAVCAEGEAACRRARAEAPLDPCTGRGQRR